MQQFPFSQFTVEVLESGVRFVKLTDLEFPFRPGVIDPEEYVGEFAGQVLGHTPAQVVFDITEIIMSDGNTCWWLKDLCLAAQAAGWTFKMICSWDYIPNYLRERGVTVEVEIVPKKSEPRGISWIENQMFLTVPKGQILWK